MARRASRQSLPARPCSIVTASICAISVPAFIVAHPTLDRNPSHAAPPPRRIGVQAPNRLSDSIAAAVRPICPGSVPGHLTFPLAFG
ncbi:MAG: hypothetical protein Kow0022_03920 [Phycisphaerales bacterium]